MATIALSRPSFLIPKGPSPGSEGVRGWNDGDYGGGSKELITCMREERRGSAFGSTREGIRTTWRMRWKLRVPIDEVLPVIDRDEGRVNTPFREAVHRGVCRDDLESVRVWGNADPVRNPGRVWASRTFSPVSYCRSSLALLDLVRSSFVSRSGHGICTPPPKRQLSIETNPVKRAEHNFQACTAVRGRSFEIPLSMWMILCLLGAVRLHMALTGLTILFPAHYPTRRQRNVPPPLPRRVVAVPIVTPPSPKTNSVFHSLPAIETLTPSYCLSQRSNSRNPWYFDRPTEKKRICR